MFRQPLLAIAVLAALAAGLAGCSPGGNASPQASASSAALDPQQLLEMGRRVSQCARQHGYPDFPDPSIHEGRIGFDIVDSGSGDPKQRLRDLEQIPECKQLMDQLQANNPRPAPITAADMQRLREFAKCLREHGVPEWPDPNANGDFPIVGTPLETEGKSQRFITASDACRQYWDRGLGIS